MILIFKLVRARDQTLIGHKSVQRFPRYLIHKQTNKKINKKVIESANKSSVVAEMGDRDHNRHGPKRRGGATMPSTTFLLPITVQFYCVAKKMLHTDPVVHTAGRATISN